MGEGRGEGGRVLRVALRACVSPGKDSGKDPRALAASSPSTLSWPVSLARLPTAVNKRSLCASTQALAQLQREGQGGQGGPEGQLEALSEGTVGGNQRIGEGQFSQCVTSSDPIDLKPKIKKCITSVASVPGDRVSGRLAGRAAASMSRS